MRIDSLTKFKELVAGGMQEVQAECLAHGLAQASEIDMSNIATNDSVRHLERRMNVHFMYMHIIEIVIFIGIIGIFVQGFLR